MGTQSTWGVSSEQGCTNMNRFVVACAFVACAYGAPMPEADYAHGVVGAVGYAGAGLVGAPVASAPAVVGQTHHSYAAGAPVVENRVEYGIVGQRTVQTGVQQVVAGHAYAVAGQETITSPKYYYEIQEAKRMQKEEEERKERQDAEMAGWVGEGEGGLVRSQEEVRGKESGVDSSVTSP